MEEEGEEGPQEGLQLQPQSGEEVREEVQEPLLLAQGHHHTGICRVPCTRGKLWWKGHTSMSTSTLISPSSLLPLPHISTKSVISPHT